MIKTVAQPIKTQILVDIKTLQNMLSVGRYSAEKIAENANAVVRVGRRKLYSVSKINRYVEAITE